MRTVQVPKCCGREMRAIVEMPKFMEMSCDVCGDVVYVKKQAIARPQMLDD